MNKVAIERVKDRIYLRSAYDARVVARAKHLGGRWAKSHSSWTFPLDFQVCKDLRAAFGQDLVVGPELTAWARGEKSTLSTLSWLSSLEGIPSTREITLARASVRTRVRENADFLNSLPADFLNEQVGVGRVFRDAPGLFWAMANRPFQFVGTRWLSYVRHGLLADQPGIGKTLQSLAALVNCGVRGKVLIVAPATSCTATWEPEIARWLSDSSIAVSVTNVVKTSEAKRVAAIGEFLGRKSSGIDFLLVNPELLRIPPVFSEEQIEMGAIQKYPNRSCQMIIDHSWDGIIGDETHKFLVNPDSQQGRGFGALRSSEGAPKFALTGTPLKGKAPNLFGTLQWLQPTTYTSKWNWMARYFEIEENGYGSKVGEVRADREEAFQESLKRVMLRRTKDELRAIDPAWMPPSKQYHDIWVKMDPKQEKSYRAMEAKAEADFDGGKLTATGVLAEFTRLKQLAGCYATVSHSGESVSVTPALPSAKFDWLVSFLEERGIAKGEESTSKVVIASQFTSMIDLWEKELNRMGIPTFSITGKTKDRDRARYQQLFQDPNQQQVRVFLINTNAGGVSITLDAADDIVLMDETWVPDEQEQVEDRVHRAGNVEHQVDVWYVRTRETIEEAIAQTNSDKSYVNHTTLDASRGLAWAREKFGWEPPRKES